MSKKLASFLLTPIFSLLLLSCQNKTVDSDLHLVLRENPQSLDPVMSQDAIAAYALGPVFEPLLQYHYLKRPYELTTLLAAEMPKYSADGLTVTIKIKSGVRFQDDPCFENGKGRELTADDFIFAWKRVLDPKTKSEGFWIFDGKVSGATEWMKEASKADVTDYSKPVPGFKALDKNTIQIRLIKKYPQLNYILATTYTSPMPFEAVKKYGPEINSHPVGTGPFYLKEFVRTSKLVYEKNKNFRGEKFPEKGPGTVGDHDFDYGKVLPFAERITVHIMIEQQPKWLSFLKGQLDEVQMPKDSIASAIENGELREEIKKKGIILTKDQSSTQWFLGFNMKDPILGKNKLLRKAIATVYDSQKDIELFGLDAALQANQIIPPNLLGHNSKIPMNKPDLEKARRLLAQAGFPGGNGLPEFNYDGESSSGSRQHAEFVKAQLAQIGIKVKINLHTRPEYFQVRKKAKHQIITDGWIADYPDPENFLQLLYGPNASPGMNNSSFQNAEYDKLYLQVAGMQQSPQRQVLINKMTDIFLEEQPWVPTWVAKIFNVRQSWLKNYMYSDFAYNVYKYYRVDLGKKKQALKNF